MWNICIVSSNPTLKLHCKSGRCCIINLSSVKDSDSLHLFDLSTGESTWPTAAINITQVHFIMYRWICINTAWRANKTRAHELYLHLLLMHCSSPITDLSKCHSAWGVSIYSKKKTAREREAERERERNTLDDRNDGLEIKFTTE